MTTVGSAGRAILRVLDAVCPPPCRAGAHPSRITGFRRRPVAGTEPPGGCGAAGDGAAPACELGGGRGGGASERTGARAPNNELPCDTLPQAALRFRAELALAGDTNADLRAQLTQTREVCPLLGHFWQNGTFAPLHRKWNVCVETTGRSCRTSYVP